MINNEIAMNCIVVLLFPIFITFTLLSPANSAIYCRKTETINSLDIMNNTGIINKVSGLTLTYQIKKN